MFYNLDPSKMGLKQEHIYLNFSNLLNFILREINKEEHAVLLHTGSCIVPKPSYYEAISGWKAMDLLTVSGDSTAQQIDHFIEKHKGKWIFSHLNYDFKNTIEKRLRSHHDNPIDFPLITLFVPQYVLILKDGVVKFYTQQESKNSCSEIPLPSFSETELQTSKNTALVFQDELVFKDPYTAALKKIRQHLQQGDIYEINYCLPFQGKGQISNPPAFWWSMQEENQAPFSALYRHKDKWLMCCSPERFILKRNHEIISQPIKGTSKRDADPIVDTSLKTALKNNQKEQAENVMIVDLVRNDLGKIAVPGSVKVDELCGIYTLKTVHQMISTISATLHDNVLFSDIINACFPMGSMTGAPKIRAMEIIEDLEFFARGLYSGSVGYISPDGNFDFNVVIRSILYDATTKNLLYPAGGAITANSDIDKEFEECLLKAKSMKDALSKSEY
jgi:para-aminobenzoate synthetase component I